MAWEDEIVGLDVASASVVVSELIQKEAAGQVDLREALEASKLAGLPYSSHPKEWPPLLEVAETRELPPVLVERYNAAGGEGTALCGIFPEIRRAWASVDNSLFLWRFDSWNGQCSEYNGEDRAICAVGLVRPKPGTFVEAIQYLLVLATPVELILIGVFCTANADGTDPYAELSLQPLPEYAIASDGVIMTCITCTDRGRIFLAGRDGHIYEMQYSTGSGWHKCCRKVCLTAGLGSLVSRWVLPNALKFGSFDPIVNMVVDNERHILYSRTEDMKLQVFDLGANGDGPVKRIAEEKKLIDPQETQYGGGGSTGSRTNTCATKASIVFIGPLSIMESKWLHAVAVLSDGRRLYLTTSDGKGCLTGQNSAYQRPCCLKVLATRPSPPLGVGGGLTFGAMSAASRTRADDLALKVETAFYSAGILMLSDLSAPALSSFLTANRDTSLQSLLSGSFGTSSLSACALREIVSSLPLEGRMLFAADVLPMPDPAVAVQSLYSDTEGCTFTGFEESCEKASRKLWARGDLATQHILPRRRIVVFSTMGMMEIIFNRPVDILRRLLESNSPRSQIEEFFKRFGTREAVSMCLMIAAKLVYDENLISNTVAEKAAEVFEDPRFIAMPEPNSLLNNRTSVEGFNMGQVVQEAEPVFSGAHEGLSLCSSRLLFPIWELPFMIIRGEVGSDARFTEGVIVCRLSVSAMQVIESKIHSLEQFMRSRRNQGRGLYGYVAGLGDLTSSVVYSESGASGQSTGRNLLVSHSQNAEPEDRMVPTKRQRLPYSSAELVAMEVRAIECLRRLLRRSSEALFLLQLISKHHASRLVQSLDSNLRQKLVHMTFHQLVCSQEGEQLAMQLISGLMEYYIGPDTRSTIDEISVKLQEGCPSYYNESDHKYFQAVDYLERASVTINFEERESLTRDAFTLLSKIPQPADLSTVCKRFEDLRFYEAVVRLPLRKAQALDPKGDAFNDKIDPGNRDCALAQREQCYNIIINALGSLAKKGTQTEFGASVIFSGMETVLDQASRDKYICQIIQLSVQWPDTAFHERLYRTLIALGLENELLEYGGSDLVSFLQNSGRKPAEEAVTAITPMASAMHELEGPIPSSHTKYLDLLAKYYVLKRQHILAAHILYRLSERQCTDAGEAPTLEQRHQYLSNAVLQAKSAINNSSMVSSTKKTIDDGLQDMLEAKLTVLQFQMKIKEELEAIASRLEDLPSTSGSPPSDPFHTSLVVDLHIAKAAKDKAKELMLELKSITQLYNEYAVPFNLWEICLEMLNFANYSGDADSKIVREIWARLLDQALSRGGVAEACSVLKRVGSNLYPGDGACFPLETLCLHLEKAALERLESGVELVGGDDVARALLAACKGAQEPVLNIYDQLLSNRAVLPSPTLRLRLLQSVLAILREWAMSALADRMGITTAGASIIFGGTSALEQTATINQGIRDKIATAANRYMTEVRRLPLPQSQSAVVYQGFRELEEKLLSPTSLGPY